MVDDDGDIFRGLGFVTLFSVHAEKSIDDLLFALNDYKSVASRIQKLPVSRKLKHTLKLVRSLNSRELDELCNALAKASLSLFERRNEVIHGRIYAEYQGDFLHSGRPNIPKRPITSKELYNLAQDFQYFRNNVTKVFLFRLPRAIANRTRRDRS